MMGHGVSSELQSVALFVESQPNNTMLFTDAIHEV